MLRWFAWCLCNVEFWRWSKRCWASSVAAILLLGECLRHVLLLFLGMLFYLKFQVEQWPKSPIADDGSWMYLDNLYYLILSYILYHLILIRQCVCKFDGDVSIVGFQLETSPRWEAQCLQMVPMWSAAAKAVSCSFGVAMASLCCRRLYHRRWCGWIRGGSGPEDLTSGYVYPLVN